MERKESLQPSDAYEGYKPTTPEPDSYGYTPPVPGPASVQHGEAPSTNSYGPPTISYEPPTGGYEPPEAGGYEPPTYTPYNPEPEADEDDDKPKPQKKKSSSFMDDDYDDEYVAKADNKKSDKSEADRIAEENFRKAAEADGKILPLLFSERIKLIYYSCP